MEDRPIRGCSGCDGLDDAPRHVMGAMNKGQSSQWHWECHAARGCTLCVEQLEAANGRTGTELIGWLAEQRVTSDG